MKDKLGASTNAWLIQTAILASLPHAVRNITAPLLPLQVSFTPLCLALIAISIVKISTLHLNRANRADNPCCIIGWCSTGVYVFVELYAVTRGNGYLTSVQAIVLNEALSLAELAAATLAYFWWCLSAPVENEEIARDLALPSLWVGFVSPLIVSAAVHILGAQHLRSMLVLCLCSGMVAYAMAYACLTLKSLACFPVGFIVGMLSCRITTCFAHGGDAYYGFYSGVVSPFWYLLVPGILVFVVASKRIVDYARRIRHGRTRGLTGSLDDAPTLVGSSAALLSDRERMVMAYAARGCSQSDIAMSLGIAESTVATYRARSLKKLRVHSVEELRKGIDDGSLDIRIASTDKIRTHHEASRSQRKPFPVRMILGVFAFLLLAAFSVFGIPFPVILSDGTRVYQVSYYVVWILADIAFICSLGIGAEVIEPRNGVPPTDGKTNIPYLLIIVGVPLLWGFQIGQFPPGGLIGCLAAIVVSALPVLLRLFFELSAVPQCDVMLIAQQSARDFLDVLLQLRCEVLLIFGSSLVLAKVLASYPFLWPIKAIIIGLIAAGSIWGYIIDEKRLKAGYLSGQSVDDQLLRLLHSRGMGDLQALVVLDCINGLSIKETCSRRKTTANTVKSYRKRAYRAFGVGCAAELREKLRKELGTTKEGTMHP